MSAGRGIALAAAALAALILAGCSYDYLQRTDRVGYSAGDAVKANLAIQTINPANPASYRTRDLGRNGYVIPEPTAEPDAE